MYSIGVIALNTFRENLRDKILYNLLLFAGLLIAASILLSSLSMGEQEKIVTDMGLAAINFIGVAIAVFVGIGLVSKEIERRTIYTIMARPISRVRFLLGKYLGLVVTLFVNLSVMLLVFLSTIWWSGGSISVSLLQAVELIFVELLVVTALALLFSTFSSAMVSASMTMGLYVIGHLTPDLKGIAEKSQNEVATVLLTGIYYLCPNLEMLNIKGQAAAGVSVSLAYQSMATLYGLFYVGLLLALSCVIFYRRDF
ncbi:MAG TPA: ABC transporter permease [Nitrospira sp.]|jgi:Cu-processing system permease protein|nr:ABC transporter permease [Nitrospira sp.]